MQRTAAFRTFPFIVGGCRPGLPTGVLHNSLLWTVTFMLLAGGIGCSHLIENRTITSFTESLENGDIEDLRAQSSPNFQENVLRRDDALDAMKQLSLPEGKPTIVDVVEKENEKRVTVEVGERKRKVQFTLQRDESSNKWLVDEIVVKRKPRPGHVNKTVSEQMELLLSIRDFLDAWESGSRDQVLTSVTPELGHVLSELPPGCLKKLTTVVAGDSRSKKGIRPQVEGHADTAVCRIPRTGGEVRLTLRQIDGHWKADDIQVLSRNVEDSLSSIRRSSRAMIAAVAFYEAYKTQDKTVLENVATETFFQMSLHPADLSTVKLPDVPLASGEFKLDLHGDHALIIARGGTDVMQISLVSHLGDEEDTTAPFEGFRVEDVALFELDGNQEKRLSALFTSHAVVQVFAQALAERDVKTLKLTATPDFNSRVWEQIDFPAMPNVMDRISQEPVRILDTVFHGPITEVTVNQGKSPMTFVVRDSGGNLLVDDVLLPALDRPNSLKTTLEVLMPIRSFAFAAYQSRKEMIRATASREFNKVVWNQGASVNKIPQETARLMAMGVSRIQLAPERAVVTVGDEHQGAKIYMLIEGERYVIDDVILVAGAAQNQRLALKQHLRQQLATSNSIDESRPLPSQGTLPGSPASMGQLLGN